MVAERICDGAILHLIQMWLKAPVMEEDEELRQEIKQLRLRLFEDD